MSNTISIVAYQIRARVAHLTQRIKSTEQEEGATIKGMIMNTERQCLQAEIAFLLDILAQIEESPET